MTSTPKQVVFSGIQPSGTLHIGNYLGAIKQWVELQTDHTAYYCIVDLHAITVPYEARSLPDYILNATALYLAAGLDPEKNVIFVQSHVSAHAELAWLLATQTPFGELSRMTQFKDKSAKQNEQTTLGLFAYPVLMAADILLYQTQIVPVGEDQTQHVELARDIAQRFNNKFGQTFVAPKAQVNKNTARIMSLSDPTKKMSKSDTPKSYVAILDESESVRQKIMGAVTETEPVISFAQSGPAVKNLLTIYQAFSEQEPAGIEEQFTGKGYKEFKEALAELVIEKLKPLQRRYKEARDDEEKLRRILNNGAERASLAANKTLLEVKEKMGFSPLL